MRPIKGHSVRLEYNGPREGFKLAVAKVTLKCRNYLCTFRPFSTSELLFTGQVVPLPDRASITKMSAHDFGMKALRHVLWCVGCDEGRFFFCSFFYAAKFCAAILLCSHATTEIVMEKGMDPQTLIELGEDGLQRLQENFGRPSKEIFLLNCIAEWLAEGIAKNFGSFVLSRCPSYECSHYFVVI